MSYTEELINIAFASDVASSDDVRALIPVIQNDGSILYKQNRAFKREVFPLDIKRHFLLMDSDDGWRHFRFNPDSQKGKIMIAKYTNTDEDGARYVMSSGGQKVYGENAIATEVLNRMHIDYMNNNWVRIQQ